MFLLSYPWYINAFQQYISVLFVVYILYTVYFICPLLSLHF